MKATAANISERRGILLCLVGPAGGGKTSIAARLLANNSGSLRKSVSVTSRAMRPGEKDGESYYFLSRAEFEARIAAGDFFEWEETHGNLYGTPREVLDERSRRGVDTVFDIDIRGASSIRAAHPHDTVTVLLVPPSPEELEKRMVNRAPLSAEELALRLKTARTEYEQMMRAYHRGDGLEYLVVNEDLEESVRVTQAILDAERRRLTRFNPDFVMRICGAPT